MSIKYSKGIMWLDDCRIPFVDETEKEGVCKSDKNIKTWNVDWGIFIYNRTGGDTKGRFAPSLLVCDDMLNDGVVRKGFNGGGGPTRFAGAIGGKKLDEYNYYGDSGSSSRYYDLDLWFDKLINELK